MKAQRGERFICDARGRKKAVILDVRSYKELLEDIEDLRLIAERRNEPTVSLDEVEKRLEARGLLQCRA